MDEELDIFQDTTAEERAFSDPLAIEALAEEDTASAEELPYGPPIDADATVDEATSALGISAEQWYAFVAQANALKSQMNNFQGNEARVMQNRSVGDAQADRRIAVLINRGMTEEEAKAEVYSSEEYQARQEQFAEYEDLNNQLGDLYESIGLDRTGVFGDGRGGGEGYKIDFDINTGEVTRTEVGAFGFDIGRSLVMVAAGAVVGPALASVIGPALGVGAAAANAAAAAIVSSASQLALTGDLDVGDALVAAATAYGGTKLGEAIGGSSAVQDAVGNAENSDLVAKIQEYVDAGYSQETIDKMYEVLNTGIEAGADAGQIADVIGDVVTGGVTEVIWGEILGDKDDESFDPDSGGFDGGYDPSLIDPQLPKLPTDDSGGGGSSEEGGGGSDDSGEEEQQDVDPEDSSADADNDGVPASQDPDDNNPDIPAQGGTEIVNETGEEVTTEGEEVEGNGMPAGLEYRWKYVGNGCFVQIDENGKEIPNTKVCDPDYTEEDYELYKVGGIFGRGTDAPFGTPEEDEEDNTPAYEPPVAGTDLGYECLPNGDKEVYTADGKGGFTIKIIKGGCLNKEGSIDPSIVAGGIGNGGDDTGGDTTTDTTTITDSDDDLDDDLDDDSDDSDDEGDDEGDQDSDDGDGKGDGTGDGDGSGDGSGDGDGFDLGFGGGGATIGSPASSSFTPFREGLSYQPVQPLPLFSVPQRDFVADINVGMRAATPELDAKGHLDQLLEKYLKDTDSMFEGMI